MKYIALIAVLGVALTGFYAAGGTGQTRGEASFKPACVKPNTGERTFVDDGPSKFRGMAQSQVLAIAGHPTRVQKADGNPNWEAWHYEVRKGDEVCKTTLSFQDGKCYAWMASTTRGLMFINHKVGPMPGLVR